MAQIALWSYLLLFLAFDARAQNPSVLIAAADHLDALTDVQSKLQATGQFSAVDVFEARLSTPSLATLQAYDAVLTWGNYSYASSAAMGSILADYIDGGGGVVVGSFATRNDASYGLSGRFDADNYWAITPGLPRSGPGGLGIGTVYVPTHPVMAGVSSFSGGSSSFRSSATTVVPGAVRIADWSTGEVLAVARDLGTAKRVDLGIFPPSSDYANGRWDASTDGDLLMANALSFVAGGSSSSSAASYDCGAAADEPSWDGSVLQAGTDPYLPVSVPRGLAEFQVYNGHNVQVVGLYDAVGGNDLTGDYTASSTACEDTGGACHRYVYSGAGDAPAGDLFVRIAPVDGANRNASFFLFLEDTCPVSVNVDPVLTSDTHDAPDAFTLEGNYPNPFNPSTRIAFALPQSAHARVAVYDVLGREVAVLVNGYLEAGRHAATWDGLDAGGRAVPSGVYLYRMDAGGFHATRTMTLSK